MSCNCIILNWPPYFKLMGRKMIVWRSIDQNETQQPFNFSFIMWSSKMSTSIDKITPRAETQFIFHAQQTHMQFDRGRFRGVSVRVICLFLKLHFSEMYNRFSFFSTSSFSSGLCFLSVASLWQDYGYSLVSYIAKWYRRTIINTFFIPHEVCKC